MAELYFDEAKFGELKSAVEAFKKSFGAYYDDAKAFQSYVEGSSWAGETRKEFTAFLSLVLQYHKAMKSEALKEHSVLLGEMQEELSSFLNFGEFQNL